MYINQEELEKLREMDLLTYLRNYDPGELVKLNDRSYTTRTHDSLKISNGKWMWWSRGFGGKSALDYLIKVKGMTFQEAIEHLNGKGEVKILPGKPARHQRLILPPPAQTNEKVKLYLKKRGIDEDIIDAFERKDKIYESTSSLAIFVGFDENKVPRYAAYRALSKERIMGECAGSEKRYAFRWKGEGETLHLFESAIDLLSYATLLKGKDWQKENYLSLGGIYMPGTKGGAMKLPVALENFLKAQCVKCIAIHFDRDKAGLMAAKGIEERLKERFQVEIKMPPFGKDFNEYLIMKKGEDYGNEK